MIDAYRAPYGAYIDLAYLYASTCNAQSQKIEMKDFVTACHKFGIDSPFPCVYSKELSINNLGFSKDMVTPKISPRKNHKKKLSVFAGNKDHKDQQNDDGEESENKFLSPVKKKKGLSKLMSSVIREKVLANKQSADDEDIQGKF